MNRSLMIPAVCCVFAFAGLLATFHRVAGGGPGADLAQFVAVGHRVDLEALTSSRDSARPAVPNASGHAPLSIVEAEQALVALTDEYLRPWRKLEASPHRLYSRVAPRFIPSITATVEF